MMMIPYNVHIIRTETHKLLCAGEVKQFDQSKVIPADYVQAGVRHTRTDHVSFVGVPRPNSQNFIAQNAGGESE